ncbi:hypothetical protein FRC14_000495 [Serendipita sp. 396]|nr:hypothetical protein FRC14_000495 [Serendipita sp. 396]KAG8779431.1 hypothetical protein FRC15_010177 [Serendipita sp. 397]
MNELVRSFPSGMPTFGYMPAVFGGRSLPEGGEGYVKVDGTAPPGFLGQFGKSQVKREPTQDAVMSSAGATAAGSEEKTAPTSSTSTAPSTSPTLAAKTTGKKSNAAAPGSPTKTSGKQEKTSKRKNTVDNEGPNKRRTRKASQAS